MIFEWFLDKNQFNIKKLPNEHHYFLIQTQVMSKKSIET